MLQDGLLLNEDGAEIEEGEEVCDGCGEKRICVRVMQSGLPLKFCFKCLPSGMREGDTEMEEVKNEFDDDYFNIRKEVIHHPTIPLGMLSSDDNPDNLTFARFSQM